MLSPAGCSRVGGGAWCYCTAERLAADTAVTVVSCSGATRQCLGSPDLQQPSGTETVARRRQQVCSLLGSSATVDADTSTCVSGRFLVY